MCAENCKMYIYIFFLIYKKLVFTVCSGSKHYSSGRKFGWLVLVYFFIEELKLYNFFLNKMNPFDFFF